MGWRFFSLDTNAFGMRKNFSEDYVIPSPKLNEHQKKKVFAGNWSVLSPKLGEDQKKRSSQEIEVVFRQN